MSLACSVVPCKPVQIPIYEWQIKMLCPGNIDIWLSNQTSFGKRGRCKKFNSFLFITLTKWNNIETNKTRAIFYISKPYQQILHSHLCKVFIWPPLSIFSGHILNLLWHMFRSNSDKKLTAFSCGAFTFDCILFSSCSRRCLLGGSWWKLLSESVIFWNAK